jgi:hypothetical protein
MIDAVLVQGTLSTILSVLSSLATSAIVSVGVVWLTKTWISERLKNSIKIEYDAKLETHKAQLKAASDTEIERLKSQLSIVAHEHSVRFEKLQERRAEAIEQTYKLLKRVFDSVLAYVSPFELAGSPSKEECRKTAGAALQEFRPFYSERIIFPESHSARLEGT